MLDRQVLGLTLGLVAQGIQLPLRLVQKGCRAYRTAALADRFELRGQALVLPLDVSQLIADYRDLALEQRHSLPMLGRKLLSDPACLGVTDIARQASAPFGILEADSFRGQLSLGGCEGIFVLPRGNLELHQRVVQAGGLGPAIRPSGKQAVEAGAQFVETHQFNVTARRYLWESTMRPPALALPVFLLLTGCSGGKTGNYGCGFSAVAGQSMLLDEFNRPGTALSATPQDIPESLPVRIALGPSFRSVTGRADTMLVVGVEGSLPATPSVGFGVLVVSPQGRAEGVMLYEGSPILGAPVLGTVNASGRNLPLIGIRLDVTKFQNQSCPIFPDSLRR